MSGFSDFSRVQVQHILYGEIKMSKKDRRCCICGEKLPKGDLGNNPEPIKPYSAGTCCNKCNMNKVIPARLMENKRYEKILTNDDSASE